MCNHRDQQWEDIHCRWRDDCVLNHGPERTNELVIGLKKIYAGDKRDKRKMEGGRGKKDNAIFYTFLTTGKIQGLELSSL